jgi:hypothetical protein
MEMRGRGVSTCILLCAITALALPGIARADRGFQGPAYPAGSSGAPTTSKPESKVWRNDGFWWAIMFRSPGEYRIHRLNARTQRWRDTGVVVDTRDSTRQDVLSTGTRLFVASHKYVPVTANDPTPDPADEMRLFRFRYNAAANRYILQGTFPIDPQKSESLVIDRAANGVLWATWVQADAGGQHHVFVKRTVGSCASGAPALCNWRATTVQLDNVAPDDISSLIRFGRRIGVMWSNTATGFIRFASHRDGASIGTWSQTQNVYGGGASNKRADDHINLKTDSLGRIYAVTKTKFSSSARPGIVLHRRNTQGKWSHHTVSRASLRRTRPIVVLDLTNNRIQVFEADGGRIHMKTSGMGRIGFGQFRGGATVIADTGSSVGNPTSTKQNVTNRTELVVLASNHATKRYWHAYRRIPR